MTTALRAIGRVHLVLYVELAEQVSKEFVAEMHTSVRTNCIWHAILTNELCEPIDCVDSTVLECWDTVQESTEIAHYRHNVFLPCATGWHVDEVDCNAVKRAIAVVDVSSRHLAALHIVAFLAHTIDARLYIIEDVGAFSNPE